MFTSNAASRQLASTEVGSMLTSLESENVLGNQGTNSSENRHESRMVPESIAIFTVAEKQIAHFKARLVFRMATPTVEAFHLNLSLPDANLIVYYVQASIGDTSIFRVGTPQYIGADSLVFKFGPHVIRSSVQFIIRGSFRYLENPTVGLVSLIFPCLSGRYQQAGITLNLYSSGLGRRHGEETPGREMRMDVQCLLNLPAPVLRTIGCNVRSVSPDGRRVFLQNNSSNSNVWSSVEFSVLCGKKNSQCTDLILDHQIL